MLCVSCMCSKFKPVQNLNVHSIRQNMDTLADEVLTKIMSYLSFADKKAFLNTSRRFKNSELVWSVVTVRILTSELDAYVDKHFYNDYKVHLQNRLYLHRAGV